MKALILAGGKGTRLRPLTYSRQKQIIPIADKEIIAYIIEDIVNSGIKEIGMVVGGPFEGTLKEHAGDGRKWNAKITYIEQPKPLGLADAVKCAQKFIGNEDFLLYLGDNLFKQKIKPFVEKFKKTDADAMIMLTHVRHPEQCGLAYLNKDGTVKRLVEKPKQPETDLGIVGVYTFRKSIFKAISKIKPSPRGELEITDAISWLIKNKYKVDTSFVSGWWEDTGNHADLLEANHLLLEKVQLRIHGTVEQGAQIEGRVGIGKNTIIRAAAKITGPCIIGENCEIRGKVGPYTSIANNITFVNGEIENSIVLDGCFIDSKKKIVNSIIGSECKILRSDDNEELIIGDKSIVKL